MTIDEAPTYELPIADSDPSRQRRTRARAHALLVADRGYARARRRSAQRWIEAALVVAVSVFYLSTLIHEALQLVSTP